MAPNSSKTDPESFEGLIRPQGDPRVVGSVRRPRLLKGPTPVPSNSPLTWEKAGSAGSPQAEDNPEGTHSVHLEPRVWLRPS